jgi:molecular chaperone IbpA
VGGHASSLHLEDKPMRHVDYTPLFRSTVGFDRLVQLLDAAASLDSDSGYPPYNIERQSDASYRISMAVAGFSDADLKIEIKENALTVRGDKKADATDRQYLHRGIGQRAFERRFQLADYVEVTGAELKDGMLNIDLVRNLPERMKPRTIAIASGDVKRLEAATSAN